MDAPNVTAYVFTLATILLACFALLFLWLARVAKHGVAGGPEGLLFLEIAFGDFDEGDITRLEDDYGRA